jgi:hypothetical protein
VCAPVSHHHALRARPSAGAGRRLVEGLVGRGFRPPGSRTGRDGSDVGDDRPYTRGAYTQCPPGADPSMFDALGEPAHGRLLFAGEHTSSARSGYADGAYASGLRAAQLLAPSGNSTE